MNDPKNLYQPRNIDTYILNETKNMKTFRYEDLKSVYERRELLQSKLQPFKPNSAVRPTINRAARSGLNRKVSAKLGLAGLL